MAASDSVSGWLGGIRTGDDDAVTSFVDRFYGPIVRLVQQRLPAFARRVADEEDVALSALGSCIRRLQAGEFQEVGNRDELWKVLVTISRRKATKHIVRTSAQKRGGGKVRGESVFLSDAERLACGLEQFPGQELTPDGQLELIDCVEHIVQFLRELGDEALYSVALLKSHGLTDDEIARELDCSTKTVERKRKRLREKA
ncbi:MAG: ECF-type sigma factor, partial [Pirellulaceae bacterium]